MEDKIIQTFENEILAKLAQTKLEAFGIKSVIDSEMGRAGGAAAWVGKSGISLRVLEKDVEKAKELLDIK